MKKEIDYNKIIDKAMRGIVRECLLQVVENGGQLPGKHHFYITFKTNHPGVKISKALKDKHKEQITIVLQHQFWDLQVGENGFSVVLSFNSVKETLEVPLSSLVSFADPGAKFGLQFQEDGFFDDEFEVEGEGEETLSAPPPSSSVEAPDMKGGKVISLDMFRKK